MGHGLWVFLLGWILVLGGMVSGGLAQTRVGEWDRNLAGQPAPSWMQPVRWMEQAGLEILTVDLHPAGLGQGLLLSTVFRPRPDGFVRVIWKSPSQSVTLCADLTEGYPSLHQRALFLDSAWLNQAGQLWIEAKGAYLEKVRLEWVESVGWSRVDQGGGVQSGSGRAYRPEELFGDQYQPVAPQSAPGAVEALLQPGPIPLQERSVRLRVPLAGVVDYARLEFWVAGLESSEHLLLTLNDGPLMELRPEVPRLEDPGYRYDPGSGRTEVGGWRRVSVFLPGRQLQVGVNGLLLAAGALATTAEILIRDLRLQVAFQLDRPPLAAPPAASAEGATSGTDAPANAGLSLRSAGVNLRP